MKKTDYQSHPGKNNARVFVPVAVMQGFSGEVVSEEQSKTARQFVVSNSGATN
jgi:hypothetical protein